MLTLFFFFKETILYKTKKKHPFDGHVLGDDLAVQREEASGEVRARAREREQGNGMFLL